MKTHTKLLAILLVLALLFSFVACEGAPSKSGQREKRALHNDAETSEETDATEATEDSTEATEEVRAPKAIVGTWKYNADMALWVDAIMAADEFPEELEVLIGLVKKLFDDVSFPVTMDLREDGSYTITIDEATMKSELEALNERLPELVPEIVPELLAWVVEQEGMTMEEFEAELQEMNGMTLDQAYEQMEDEILSEFDVEALMQQLTEGMPNEEGSFQYREGILTFNNGRATTTYLIELSGDELKVVDIEGIDNSNGIFDVLLPMIFVR